MSEYIADVVWIRTQNEKFIDSKYCREHTWSFDGGLSVKASASVSIVPPPYSIEANIDPEEAFVASISSCHLLFFLSIAAKNNFVVNEYIDRAIGIMGSNSEGKMSIVRVTLQPRIKFDGANQPSKLQIEQMHSQAHEQCFIANSVKTEISIEIP